MAKKQAPIQVEKTGPSDADQKRHELWAKNVDYILTYEPVAGAYGVELSIYPGVEFSGRIDLKVDFFNKLVNSIANARMMCAVGIDDLSPQAAFIEIFLRNAAVRSIMPDGKRV